MILLRLPVWWLYLVLFSEAPSENNPGHQSHCECEDVNSYGDSFRKIAQRLKVQQE